LTPGTISSYKKIFFFSKILVSGGVPKMGPKLTKNQFFGQTSIKEVL